MRKQLLSIIAAICLSSAAQIKACSEGCLEGLLAMLRVIRPQIYIAIQQERIAGRQFLMSFGDPQNFMSGGSAADRARWERQLNQLNVTRNRLGLGNVTEAQLLENPRTGLGEANTTPLVDININ